MDYERQYGRGFDEEEGGYGREADMPGGEGRGRYGNRGGWLQGQGLMAREGYDDRGFGRAPRGRGRGYAGGRADRSQEFSGGSLYGQGRERERAWRPGGERPGFGGASAGRSSETGGYGELNWDREERAMRGEVSWDRDERFERGPGKVGPQWDGGSGGGYGAGRGNTYGVGYGGEYGAEQGYGSFGRESGPGGARFSGSASSGFGSFGGRHTGKGPKGYTRSDERIKEQLSERLEEHADIDASEITVDVKDGEVTLEGTVEDRGMKRLAEDLAEDSPGVKQVHNRIRVAPSNGRGSGMSKEKSAGIQGSAGSGSERPSRPRDNH